jgi:hypothetical protein
VVPPVAASAAEYALFTRPEGKEVVVIAMPDAAAEMVSVSFAVAVSAGWLESVTINVSASPLMAVVGVPPIAPLEVLRERPAGSVPPVIDHA